MDAGHMARYLESRASCPVYGNTQTKYYALGDDCFPDMLEALEQADREGRRIAAICAAPGVVLGRHGLLKGRTATCFPGFEKEFQDGCYTHQGVVTDGNLTTARGLGFAVDLGLTLVELLLGSEAAEDTRRRIQYT